MSDKLRSAFPISVNFSDGELPTAAKMRGLARQAKNGLSIVEYAIGDLWNQGGDSFLSEGGTSTANALMIANLARYMGSAKLTSPRIPYLPNLNQYTQLFYTGDGFVGTQEAYLNFPPGGSTYTWAGGASYSSSPKATKAEVLLSTDWYTDTTSGYCYFGQQLANGYKVTYTPNTSSVTDQDDESQFNIIPSPYTNSGWAFRGCKIAYANNTDNSQGYIIYFPPRGPLENHVLDRGPQDSFYYGNSDNYSATPDSSMYLLFWQDQTQDAATHVNTAAHYRYNLPYALTSSTYFVPSSTIPVGFLHIWDHYVTQTIITGVTITLDSTPHEWAVVVSGSSMNTWVTNNLTACGYPSDSLTQRDNHDPLYYPANGLKVITVGSSLSSHFSRLSQKFYDHDHHSGSSLCTKPISHAHLLNCVDASVLEGTYPASAKAGDHHPQYLHRDGIRYTGSQRDIYGNGMWGDLLFLSQNYTDNYMNLLADSWGIRFGEAIDGPYINYNQYFDSLAIVGKDTTIVNRLRMVNAADGGEIAALHIGLDGEVAITDNTGTALLPSGGTLRCDKYKSGYFTDTSWSYGTSGGGYGPLRKIMFSPLDFHYFLNQDTSYPNITVSDDRSKFVVYRSLVPSDPDIVGVGYLAYASAFNQSHALLHIHLPFSAYCIVNASMAVQGKAGTFSANELYATLGYVEYLGAAAEPTADAASTTVDVHDSTGDVTINVWSALSDLFPASSTPLIEIENNIQETRDCKMPYFKLLMGSAGTQSVWFGPVTIWYRVKEF